MNKAEHQVDAVERLLDRQRNMSSFGYSDGFITVSLEEVAGALAEGAAAYDAQVCPECQQGKHGNCTEEVLLPDDSTLVQCACKAQGHGE